ncbi:MAG: putative toxin-antitoxin system toxin component, PIN family [Deltaproteobacteria bacterium]
MCSDPIFSEATAGCRKVVLDTNIVLDVFVFNDPTTAPLLAGLKSGTLHWLATQPMRDELERVLAYPKIVKRLAGHQLEADMVLAQFDALAQLQPVAGKAAVTCKDPDDQKFIDLAVAHKTLLLSKDQAVLCMAKRLLALAVTAQAAIK